MLLEHVSCFHTLLEHSFCGHSTNRFNKQTLSLTQNMHTKHSQTFTPPTLFLSPVRTQKPYTRHQPKNKKHTCFSHKQTVVHFQILNSKSARDLQGKINEESFFFHSSFTSPLSMSAAISLRADLALSFTELGDNPALMASALALL